MANSDKSGKAQSATLMAVDEIKKQIFSGELPADSNHFESELAERLGISRTPVREATLVLEAQGLLKVVPRKGVRIKAISVDDMDEVYQILTELESLAARCAAKAGYSKLELATLSTCIDQMDKALAWEDLEAWAHADEAFHSELVRLAGNRRIQDIVSNFNDTVRRVRLITLNQRPLPTQSNEDHRQLYEAIATGDSSSAHKIHRKHRQQASKMLITLLKKSGVTRW